MLETKDLQNLTLDERIINGKNVKKLRRSGFIPANIFGLKSESESLQIESSVLSETLKSVQKSTPILIQKKGDTNSIVCFIEEIQRHPITEEILHVSFKKVDTKKPIKLSIFISITGEAPGVKNLGGILLQPLNYLSIRTLPLEVPSSIVIDVSNLEEIGNTIAVKDISDEYNCEFLDDPSSTIVRIVPPRIEEEEEEEVEEDLEGEEGMEIDGEATTESEDSAESKDTTEQKYY